ncbi:DUF63 family protein [Methanobrevibacter sp. DSM 116169]|uniref:DUF63 family protein n=1 Tax=Methanobrevibacter sp. DSM 116169 TaxID=3242727 RepID=UPI0038FCF1DA
MDFFILKNIIDEYFFSGYTIFNTVIYAIILIIILELILKLFNKIKINPKNIIYSIIPFIFFGSGVRALVDNNILQYNYLTITPGIYLSVGILAILSLIIGYILRNIIDYRISIFLLALPFGLYPFFKMDHFNLEILSFVILLWIILTSLFYLIGKYWSLLKDKINLSIISAHLLDATTTFVAVDFYGYNEQHVLPSIIYNIFDTAIIMYPLKIIVIISCIYLIDKYIDDEILNGLIKLAIFVLGLAPGIRNLLTMLIGI